MFKNNGKEIEKVQEMSYEELVSQEHDYIINGFLKNRKRLEDGINEALAANREGSLTSIIVKLREEEVINEKELYQAGLNYSVDTELQTMAAILDKADQTNKDRELLFSIGPKINEILAMLPEIGACYGGSNDFYAPGVYVSIKAALQGAAVVMNAELPRLQKVDKELLKQKIKGKMKLLKDSKMESQAIKDKYK